MPNYLLTFIKKWNKLMVFYLLIGNSLIYEVTKAQDNLGIKYFGLSIHPKGEKDNAFLMPYKLDKYAYFVLNFGTEMMYEKFFYKDFFSFKVVQSLYADCASRLGGFSHVGIRAKILKKQKHSLYGGIGPTFIFRRNWQEIPGYINPKRFKGDMHDRWQHLFLWYGGEFEYKYIINENFDFAISFIPGYPDLMSLAIGINKKIK